MTVTPTVFSRPSLDAITERELDLLLLLALHVLPPFRDFVVEAVARCSHAQFLGAWRGVYDQDGESDLVLVVQDAEGYRLAILVEDKIDARFQGEQAQRYAKRGKAGIAAGRWDRFLTCLCAPESYAKAEERSGWDAFLSIETMQTHFAQSDNDVAKFLSTALGQVIDKFKNGGAVPNAQTTAFWRSYEALCRNEFPDLELTPLPSRIGINDPWPRFSARRLPSNVRLEHKPRKGVVDMTFSGRTVEDVKRVFEFRLPEGFSDCSNAAVCRYPCHLPGAGQP